MRSPKFKLVVLALFLVSAGVVTAQSLTLSGSCPGAMTIDVAGATPNGQVALLTGTELGPDTVPGGPCLGSDLDVTGDLVFRTVLTADGAGTVNRTVSIPGPVCGAWLQALDVGTCGSSNAAPFEVAGPVSIDLVCVPTSNPLRAGCTVTVDPPQAVEVRYSRVDGLGVERANRSELVAGTHEVPLLFMAPLNDYTVEAVALAAPQGLSAIDTVTTGAPPFDTDSWLEMTGNSTMGLIGGEIACSDDAVAAIYDTTTGDLVWYEDIDPSGGLGVLDMVRYTDEQTVVGETGNSIVEVDLTGGGITDFDVDYPGCCNLHHDVDKQDDLYYSFYQDTQAGLTLDAVVVFDAAGNELFEWNPRDHLPIPPGSFGDWLHTNSIWVEEDGTALFSWLTRDSVAKVDLNPSSPTFGDVLWIMDGNPPDELPADITIDWSGVPGPDSFGGQHNFNRRHDGRYMLLDNDHGRGVVLSIDEVNRTATADAVYSTRENVCGPQGTATDTEDGNALVACTTEFMREYDGVTDQLIWEAEIICANGGGGFFGNSSARWYALDGWSNDYLPTP